MAKQPTATQRTIWGHMKELGCAVCGSFVDLTIHHCGTGAGGRKNHDFCIPLCWYHHQGPQGIDGREYGISKKEWQKIYGTEQQLWEKTMQELGMP